MGREVDKASLSFMTAYSGTLPSPFLFFNYLGIQPAEVSLGLQVV
jgi:hypothetical protein